MGTTTVTIPGVGDVDFPDTMSHEDITSAIENDVVPQKRSLDYQEYVKNFPAQAAKQGPAPAGQKYVPIAQGDFEKNWNSWQHETASKYKDNYQLQSAYQDIGRGMNRVIPAQLAAPPALPSTTGYMGIPQRPDEKPYDFSAAGKATWENVKELAKSASPILARASVTGEGGTGIVPPDAYTPPQPTHEEIQRYRASLGRPLLPLSAGAGNPLDRGVLGGLESLTSPENLAIMGATAGVGSAVAPFTQTGLGAVGVKSAMLALHGLFTYQLAHGAGENWIAAKQAFDQGDLNKAVELTGAGSVEALLALAGVHHGVQSVRDIGRTPIPVPPEEAAQRGQPGPYAKEQKGISPRQEGLPAPGGEPPPPPLPGGAPGPPGSPTSSSLGEPPPPSKVTHVSESTPNPATAGMPTTQEAPETLAIQLEQLKNEPRPDGTVGPRRRVVMYPKGTPTPDEYPEGTAVTHDDFGNIYVFRPDLITRSEIKGAAKSNKLNEVLGSAVLGLGAPDKSGIPAGQAVTVVVRDQNGTEVQATATTPEYFPHTMAAMQHLMPPGGSVSVEDPGQVLGERQGAQPQPAPVPAAPAAPAAPQAPAEDLAAPTPVEPAPAAEPAPASQTGLDQLGQMGTAITQNMYQMLWPKVEAGDINEAGAPSALLQAAKMVRAGGGLQTLEQFQAFAQEYAQIPRGDGFQQAMRDLVARHIPAAPAQDLAQPGEVGGQQTTTPVDTASTQLETRPQWAKDDEESKARAKAREIVIAEDKDDGIAAVIAPIDNGKWFGGLRDTDADEMVGGQIFKTREKATAYARTLIRMKGEPRDFGLPQDPEAQAPPAPTAAPEPQAIEAQPEEVGEAREAEGPHGTWLLAIPDSGMWTVLAVHPKHQGGTISADDFPLVHRTIKDVLDKRDLGFENVVGYANLTPFEHTDGTFHSTFTEVVPDWRRRGIASALYDFGENVIGAKITPSKAQTEDGDAFSNSRGGPKEPAPAAVTQQDLAEPESADVQPEFKEGDRVTWTGQRGAVLTGTIRSIEKGTIRSPGEPNARLTTVARIDADQIVSLGGRVPIQRVETVELSRLKLHEEEPAEPPKPSEDLAAPTQVEPPTAAPQQAPQQAPEKSFKYEFQIQGEGDKWHDNAVRYASREEAEKAGNEHFSRWMMATGVRVVESDEAPNYRWDAEKGSVRIEEQPEQQPEQKPEDLAPPAPVEAPAASEWEPQEKFVNPRTGKELTIEKSTKSGKYSFVLENGARSVYSTDLSDVRARARIMLGLSDGARPRPIAAAPAPETASSTKDLKIGDLVRYQGKVYEVGYRGGGDKIRLQDPVTHEGTLTVFAGQPGLERVSREEYEKDLAPPTPVDQPEPEAETTEQDEATPEEVSGAVKLVNAVYEKLRTGGTLGNVTELTKMAEEAFGSGRTSGQWSPKEMFDAMEAGINKYLVRIGKQLIELPFNEGMEVLRNLMSRITTQGVRTEDQIKNQQFSTPPTQSYLAAKVADLRPTDVMLEPSAGNGGLAAFAKAVVAEVHVNEIGKVRQAMLEAVGFGTPSAHDGEIIHALLDGSIKPTVVVMNPPFSASTLKSHEARNRNVYGFNHVESALQRLEPGGRLVAILGGGQANEPEGGASLYGTQSGKWFDKIARQYNVRANVRINGKEYQKYGTSFATRLIVIDKTGPTPSDPALGPTGKWDSTVKGNVDTLEEAYGLLRGIAGDRPATAAVDLTPRPGSKPSPRPGESGTGVAPGQNASPGSDSGSVRPGGETPTPVQLPGGPHEPNGGPGDVQSSAGNQPTPLRGPETEPAQPPGPKADEGAGSSAQVPDTERPLSGTETLDEQPQLELQSEQQAASDEREREDTEAYVEYKPTLKGPEHPGSIVETKTMATVPMPKITHKPNLPASVLENNRLSAVQLEAIAIAGQQNAITLPSGHYASALIGDGTGVGKGRISAGILWDNWRQGRKRLVWVSEKWDLMQDAMRDLDGIGATDLLRNVTQQKGRYIAGKGPSGVRKFGDYDAPDKIQHEGVLFSTYSLIRSEDKKGNTRVAQLEQWLRGDDDGEGAYILFDESHNLKNAVANQGGEISQIGEAVKSLLERMPKLRTVSLSATAATDVVNLGYLDRLGLWGPGTPFPNGFGEFQSQVANGGVAAMELIARELKAQGKYLSRTLSFKGVEYSEAEHQVNDDQKDLYRTAAKAWASIIEHAESTIQNTTNGGARAKGRFMSLLGSAQQRFFNLLITTLKIPTCIELAQQALKNDKAVVITLVNTNEAAQNREKNKAKAPKKTKNKGDDDEGSDDEIDDLDFGPKELLIDLVRNHYPVQQWVDDVDATGKPIKVPVTRPGPDGKDIPVLNPQAVAERDALIAEINRDLHLPENPLDSLIQGLGGRNKVAELTGRKEVYDRATGEFIPRGDPGVAKKDYNLSEMRNFQSGTKKIAILSSAAGTGISLHASNQAANQLRRYQICLQVGWSADKQMQMFGRTHRTDQASAPEYVMLVSDLGGEKRFVSTIARRLGSLGALTKGQKNATSGTDLMEKVNFETDQGRQATNSFYTSLLQDQPVPGTGMTGLEVLAGLRVLRPDPQSGSLTVSQADRTNVTRLLNRLLALDPDIQNPAYNYFYDLFQAAVQDAIDRNRLDTGVRTLPGDQFTTTQDRVIATDPKTGATTHYQPVEAKVKMERVSPAELKRRYRAYKDQNVRVLTGGDGEKLILAIDANPIVHADGRVEDAAHVAEPGNGKWQKVPLSQLRNGEKVADWSSKRLKQAEREVQNTQGDLDYYKKSYESDLARERERQQRTHASRVNALEAHLEYTQEGARRSEVEAELAKERNALEAAKTYEFDNTHYTRARINSLEEKLAKEQETLANAQKVAADPAAWTTERWGELFEASPTHNLREHHFITGAVMRFWNPIKESTFIRNSIYTTTDSKTGRRVVGIDIPASQIRGLLARIEGGASTVNHSQLHDDVLKNALSYELEGDIQVRQGRIGREKVIQMIPPNNFTADHLKRLGLKYERGLTPVYYVPNTRIEGNTTHDILKRVLQEYPVKAEAAQPDQGISDNIQLPKIERSNYRRNADDTEHAKLARIAPIELPEADAERGMAHMVNRHVIELVSRWRGKPRDSYSDSNGALYFQGPGLDFLVDRTTAHLSRYQTDPPAAIVKLRDTAIDARDRGLSLILLGDIAEEMAQVALREELNHLLQAALLPAGKTLNEHLGRSAFDLLASDAGNKAMSALAKFYEFRSLGDAASEIGVRLMVPGRHTDLDLSEAEASGLAQLYDRLLEEEYGKSATEEIRQRIADAYPSGVREGDTRRTDRTPDVRQTGASDDEGIQESRSRGPGAKDEQSNPLIRFLKDETGESNLEPLIAAAKTVSRKFSAIVDDAKRVFAPQTRGEQAQVAAGNMREMMGTLAQRESQVHAAIEQYRRLFYKLTPEHGVHGLSIIDAIEGGPQDIDQLPPEFEDFARTVRKAYDDRKQLLKGLGIVKHFLENYFTHMYKDPKQAEAWTANWLSRRPMAGSEHFKKQRVYPTLREAIEDKDFTLVPRFDNPVDYVYAGLAQMDKSIAAHEVFEEWKEKGYLKYGMKRPAAGFSRIDDKLFTVFGPRRGAVKIDPLEPTIQRDEEPDEFEARYHAWEEKMAAVDDGFISPRDVRVFGRREMGYYWAPDQMAQVVNNYLSHGYSGKAGYDVWMAVKGNWNILNLSISAFHAATTTLNAILSDFSLGGKYLLAGEPVQAAKSVGKAVLSPVSLKSDYSLGKRIASVMNGTATNPTAMELAIGDAFRQAGGRYLQSLNTAPYLTGLKNALAKNNKAGALLRAANPLLWMESTVRPIMEHWVPPLKMAAFAKAVQFELMRRPDMDPEEARRRFGAIQDSMDDRFGQLNQANMLMDNTVRSWMNIIVSRPGWTAGTLRAVLGGAWDLGGNLNDLAHGRRTELSHRSAFLLLGILLGSMLINALTNVLFTGEMPSGVDFLAPRDGGLTEDGRPSRIIWPLYLPKDVYSWSTDPLGTGKAKLSQPLMVAADMATNRDFSRHKIWGHGGIGAGWYFLNALLPFAFTGAKKNYERHSGTLETALPFVGIMPARPRMGLSGAEKIIQGYRDEHGDLTRPAPSDHTRARSNLFLAVKSGLHSGDMSKAVGVAQEAVKKGQLTRSEAESIFKRAEIPSLLAGFEGLPISEDGLYAALTAYKAATPAERDQLKSSMNGKLEKAFKKPNIWDPETRSLVKNLFHVDAPRAGDFAAPAAVQ